MSSSNQYINFLLTELESYNSDNRTLCHWTRPWASSVSSRPTFPWKRFKCAFGKKFRKVIINFSLDYERKSLEVNNYSNKQ